MNTKTIVIATVFIMAVLVVSGCTSSTPPANNTQQPEVNAPSGEQTTPTEEPAPTEAQSTIGADQIYRYEAVKNYEYKITSEGITANLKQSVVEDIVDGKAAWLQTSETTTDGTSTTQGATSTMKMWLDKTTFACLKIVSVVEFSGEKTELPASCPPEGPNAGSTSSKALEFQKIGTESVTVPAGTFTADKYTSEGVTYWVASSVPIPVKVLYTSTTIELVNFAA